VVDPEELPHMSRAWSERQLRRLIVKACQAVSQKGYVAATDGNISALLGANRVLVTGTGTAKGDIRERDLLVCDLDGRRISGPGKPSCEIQVHLAAYRARPEIRGVVHAHPPLATAFTFVGRQDLLNAPIVPEVIATIGPIPCVPYFTPGTRELAAAAEACFKSANVVLLSQHGVVAVGADPWAAYLRLEKVEYLAQVLKHALELASGDARQIQRLNARQIAPLKQILHRGERRER
jgi:L-fuculose-phosphate aldolase